ncbi:MAG: hypothetical protein ACLSB9_06370 [Hydrogeniiclostridium mannosilyticum]
MPKAMLARFTTEENQVALEENSWRWSGRSGILPWASSSARTK